MIGRANAMDGTEIHDQVIGLSGAAFQPPEIALSDSAFPNDPITRAPDSSEPPDQPITQSVNFLASSDDPITPSPDSGESSDGLITGAPDDPITEFLDAEDISKFGKSRPDLRGRGLLRARGGKRGAPAGRRRLPQFVQALAEQMLAQGSTSEEVAQAARECGFTHTTAAKVDRWLEQDKEARERIVQRQMKTAKDLQASIGAAGAAESLGPDVALLGEQAESLSAGTSSPLDVQNLAAIHRSLRAQLQTENDRLKRRAKRLEARKVYLARRIEHAQMRLDHARLEVVQSRLGDLRDALEESAEAEQEQGRSLFAEIVASLCQLLGVRC
jgi:hypothetical protein